MLPDFNNSVVYNQCLRHIILDHLERFILQEECPTSYETGGMCFVCRLLGVMHRSGSLDAFLTAEIKEVIDWYPKTHQLVEKVVYEDRTEYALSPSWWREIFMPKAGWRGALL